MERGAALVLDHRPNAPPSLVASLLTRRTRPFRAAVARVNRRLIGAGVLDFLRLGR